jgi:hypothetical protein
MEASSCACASTGKQYQQQNRRNQKESRHQ